MRKNQKSHADIINDLLRDCNVKAKTRLMMLIQIVASKEMEHELSEKDSEVIFRMFADCINLLSDDSFNSVYCEALKLKREPKYSKKVIFLSQVNG